MSAPARPNIDSSQVLANHLTVSQAASRIGFSPDTIRTWAANGRLKSVRDGRKIMIPEEEVRRATAERQPGRRSATNRFSGTVVEIEDNGLMSQVEVLVTYPVRLVATITADAVEQMNLKPGMPVKAVFAATAPVVLGANEA
jgi:molybdopterin-binding protein